MALGEAVIAVGIGCRRGTSSAAVLLAVDAALAGHTLSRAALGTLATLSDKAHEAGVAGAALALAVPLRSFDADSLAKVEDRSVTRSERSRQATGVSSVSEAAALAAAGPGGRLLGPRLVCGPVTCALAISGDAP